MATHPEWATKHRGKGTELRFLNGRYYLYEVSSKWDPQKKRSKKITGKLLGKITKEDGFIESDKAKLRRQILSVSKLTVKEYGVTAFVNSQLEQYKTLLQKYFPEHWQKIIVLAYGRMVYHSPMKNMEFHYHHSFMSVQYKGLKLSHKQLTIFLREFGVQREQIISFFKEFSGGQNNILFDGTDMFSNSKKIEITKYSKTKKGTFDSVANLMFAFSVDLQLPLYYRFLPGNIKDIKAFKLCLEELKISNAVVIADKGFSSKKNIEVLLNEKLIFIIPLKRNNKLIDYSKIEQANKRDFDGFFKFQGRIIWYYSYSADNLVVNIYLDEELKLEESKDYLHRIETMPKKYSLNGFYEKQHSFGTIALLHNSKDQNPETVYVNYKSRNQIEEMINVLKNIMEADSSYMQNEQALETWMFINYITLHWYYKIYQFLVKYEMNKKYSPMDFILFLKEIRKVKMNGKWFLAEITAKTEKLLDKLNIPIT
ncbi:MAG: hypothetical protein IEMM0006_1962 [bacterium]|nr:MAG: hypothetical protein IEMM0006_1962 [bacterium]